MTAVIVKWLIIAIVSRRGDSVHVARYFSKHQETYSYFVQAEVFCDLLKRKVQNAVAKSTVWFPDRRNTENNVVLATSCSGLVLDKMLSTVKY